MIFIWRTVFASKEQSAKISVTAQKMLSIEMPAKDAQMVSKPTQRAHSAYWPLQIAKNTSKPQLKSVVPFVRILIS
jgi:hypothetical protein